MFIQRLNCDPLILLRKISTKTKIQELSEQFRREKTFKINKSNENRKENLNSTYTSVRNRKIVLNIEDSYSSRNFQIM